MAHFTCEVVYRGIFQKNLAARIARGIVLSARKAGRWGIAFGRYGDSPQRNGIPAKDFAIVADTQEELEQNMARYEPKEVDVTICVDDTLVQGRGVVGLVRPPADQPADPARRHPADDLAPAAPSELLKDIHKKDAPYNLALIRAKASFSGLWVYKEDHTEARILGALAKIAAGVPVAGRGVRGHRARPSGARISRWRPPARPTSGWRRARSRSPRATRRRRSPSRSRSGGRCGKGVTIPAIPVGKPMEDGKGYVPERNPYFKKFTTRTMRPVIDFDTCVKCTLCWIQCPDSCFDVTPDGLYDANMESCCGCGVCEAVCPVKDCITMVNEAAFEDNASQWEMWRKDKGQYTTWMTEQDPRQVAHRPLARLPLPRPVRGGDPAASWTRAATEITAGIPGENAAEAQV